MGKQPKATQSTSNETNTVEMTMKMIADSQKQLKEDIKFLNVKYGSQLTKEDRDEILSIVSLKALEAAKTYNPKLSKMRTWLSSIARNEIVTYLRQRYQVAKFSVRYIDESDDDGRYNESLRQMHYALDEEERKTVGVFGKEADRQTLLQTECLTDAILSLSDRDQAVIFMLRQGLSGRQMADALGIKETAQRKLVFDMRGRLRKCLADKHFADIAEHSNKYCNSVVTLEDVANLEFKFMQADRSEMDGLLA